MFSKKKADGDRIRIAHVTGWLHFGGKENGIVNLVNALDPDVFENYIFTFVRNGPLTKRIDPERCRVVELGERLGGDYRLYFKLAREFRRHRIHIAHTHSWATLLEGLIGAKLALVPVVIHGEHGTIKADSRAHIYVQRLLWRVADQVTAVSSELRENLCRTIGFPRERIHVILNGVDLGRLSPAADGAAFKARLGLPADAPVFGTIGRLVPVKAYPVLLEACRRVLEEIPRAHVVIVGEGPLGDELARTVEEHGIADRVRFLGWRPDVPDVLKALDLFVLASHSEGMSNTILEAMASGLPVVATRVGGNPELVVDGQTGILVPPAEPEPLAQAVLRLLRDPESRSTMGARSRRRATEEFGMPKMVRGYASLYRDVFLRRLRPNGRLRHKLESLPA